MYAGTPNASVAVAALLGAGTLLLSAALTDAPDTGTAGARRPVPVAHAAPGAGVRTVGDPSRRLDGAPVVIAHRGASAYAPENTLAAVDRADALGFDWVENDVQLTRDGVPVVVHDTGLKRTTDAEEVFPDRSPWAVGDFTAAEIARLDAGSWFGARFAGARVPTLRQYLRRLTENGQSLLLEIKSPERYPGIEDATLAVLGQEGWLDGPHVRDRLVVQSFDADSVRTVHARRPDVVTGVLGAPARGELPAYARFTDRINPSHTALTADYVAAVHALKGPHGAPLQVDAWTVNDARAALRVSGFGVDGIITNAPDVVREATTTG
ncbi:glycerophosphodiester phosphodiesterase [Streptomyces sp. NPDC059783]|uniref:glycerophosphodiester phosphodiesterase n=1 Tax=Streptomyces sp. NPDC059783 TaxID=3346944 RepID=UPI003664FFF0